MIRRFSPFASFYNLGEFIRIVFISELYLSPIPES
jgi:hypothetical protein